MTRRRSAAKAPSVARTVNGTLAPPFQLPGTAPAPAPRFHGMLFCMCYDATTWDCLPPDSNHVADNESIRRGYRLVRAPGDQPSLVQALPAYAPARTSPPASLCSPSSTCTTRR